MAAKRIETDGRGHVLSPIRVVSVVHTNLNQPAYPLGLPLCQRQASAHIAPIPRSARHPNNLNARCGSA